MPHRSDRSVIRLFGRWTQSLFLIACFIAVIVTLVSFIGVGPITPASRSMIWLLAINFILIGILAFYVGRDVFNILPGRAGTDRSKLAIQFSGLFSLAAVVPAILVAIFLGTSLNRSIESWFSDKIKAIVENSATVSRSNLQTIAEDIRVDVGIMAQDLNNAVEGFKTEQDKFTEYLRRQASFRDFTGALILDANGKVLLGSDPATTRSYEMPDQDMIKAALQGDVAIQLSDETSRFWALFRLKDFESAFLYTVRPINPGLLESLVNSEEALTTYRTSDEQSRRLQIIFLLGFVQITALILLYFIRYGVWAANQITRPIARLASASEDVKKGDLTVQVKLPQQENEIYELTESFNSMTQRLRQQRCEIDEAHKEALERSQFIEAVLSSVSAGVVRVDNDLTVTLANPSAVLMFPALSYDEDGINLTVMGAEFAELAQSAIASREAKAGTVILTSENDQQHFTIRAEPSDDDLPGCVLTFDDTTRLIIAQRQMAWREVARRVAHEIRNPLTPIQLSAERLRRRYRKLIAEDDAVFDRCIDTITRQVNDIGRMVEEFSSFARMPKPEIQPFDITEVVRNCVFDARLSKPEIDYPLEMSADSCELKGDKRLLGQAITNLLKNAGEAVERAQGFAREVRTTLQFDDEFVTIDIEDTGVGFPDNRQQILEPYFTTREQGIGLGLAIVNRIVQDHGGFIMLLDRLDEHKGARVRMRLPVDGPDLDQVASWNKSKELME